MPTSSIIKQFVIKEKRAIDKLIELENKEVKPLEVKEKRYQRGKELLSSFPFR